MALQPFCWALASFFLSSLSYTLSVGLLGRAISVSQGVYLYTGQHKRTSMPRVGFEPTISVFERAKTVRVSDLTSTVIGWRHITNSKPKYQQLSTLIRSDPVPGDNTTAARLNSHVLPESYLCCEQPCSARILSMLWTAMFCQNPIYTVNSHVLPESYLYCEQPCSATILSILWTAMFCQNPIYTVGAMLWLVKF
jgi:hypothetical protein